MQRAYLIWALVLVTTIVLPGCASQEKLVIARSGDNVYTVDALLEDPFYDQTISVAGVVESSDQGTSERFYLHADGKRLRVIGKNLHKSFSENIDEYYIHAGDKVLLIGTLQNTLFFTPPAFYLRDIRVIERAASVQNEPVSPS